MKRSAAANVTPIRQTTQYNCMAASMSMALLAQGVNPEEATTDRVNKVMGARPMNGASWENALACAQHYGMRGTLVTPSTVQQLKAWTDKGVPVMIAWNPEGRPWSHASLVFDVDDQGNVHVADPNIPDPDETVRVVPKPEFYGKWYEKWPDYLVRRPAMAIEREITSDGRAKQAAKTKKADLDDTDFISILDENLVRFPKGDGWWLPAHKLAVSKTKIGWYIWAWEVLTNRNMEYFPATEDAPAGIILTPVWVRTNPYRPLDPTPETAYRVLAQIKKSPTVGAWTQQELQRLESMARIQIPSSVQARLVREAPKIAARRWGSSLKTILDTFVPLDGQKPIAVRPGLVRNPY